MITAIIILMNTLSQRMALMKGKFSCNDSKAGACDKLLCEYYGTKTKTKHFNESVENLQITYMSKRGQRTNTLHHIQYTNTYKGHRLQLCALLAGEDEKGV